jgi:acyl dehydratase
MSESLVTPEARAMVGREIGSRSGVVDLKAAQRFAAAVGDHNPIYFDEAAARAAGHAGVVAPPLFLPHVVQDVTRLDALREDGVPLSGGADIPLKAARLMAGGEDYEFHAPLHPGDCITARTRIAGIDEKSGRSGPFVLVRMATEYTNQDGALVARGEFSFIAR